MKIRVGLSLRDKEVILWRGKFKISKFVPASRKGITYMLEIYFICLWMNLRGN